MVMQTYFMAVQYKGTAYAGFQIQQNAQTIQGEVESAMAMFLRLKVTLTGSSRTDAGVHANRNFFHFIIDRQLSHDFIYHVNAILPRDIVVTGLYPMQEGSHSRFDAIGRLYRYHISNRKDPFLNDRSWYLPFPLEKDRLIDAATALLGTHDYTSFAKRNAQVFTHDCTISKAEWERTPSGWVFTVQGNRFLRGMVRALVGTMVKVGRGRITQHEFEQIMRAKDCSKADFSAPAHGLFLENVLYNYLPDSI
jgi:tRNA pseudouridine38-40 synthase